MSNRTKWFLGTVLFTLTALWIFQLPALAESATELFTTPVTFQKVISVLNGINNSVGPVKVKDNLIVTGNLTVKGDSDIQLSAKDVIIQSKKKTDITGQSFLESTTLQAALDNELAVNLNTLLPDTTWNVTNITKDETYEDTTGQITFNEDGTITLESGRVAVAGWVASSEDSDCTYPENIEYTIYNNNVMFLTWDAVSDGNSSSDSTAITLFANSTDSLGMIGTGGCGQLGSDRISVLERITE